MPTERRVRLTTDQIERVHRFALAENRSFDGAARRLINIGLACTKQLTPSADAIEQRQQH